SGTLDGRVFEASHPVQLRLLHPLEQLFELGVRLAREADDEGAAQYEIRTLLAPRANAGEGVFRMRRAAHTLEHARAAVLERHVEIGQYAPLFHERDDVVDVRVGINIV